jgi:hypothetical protein
MMHGRYASGGGGEKQQSSSMTTIKKVLPATSHNADHAKPHTLGNQYLKNFSMDDGEKLNEQFITTKNQNFLAWSQDRHVDFFRGPGKRFQPAATASRLIERD